MTQEWILARDALRFVGASLGLHRAKTVICRRAHQGRLATKAVHYKEGPEQKEDCILPASFWWAEGQEALDQDWGTGDFSTWIKKTTHLQAFDVAFDFVELCNLVPASDRATAMAEISVAGNPEWLTAREASRLVLRLDGVVSSLQAIVEYCRTSHVVARAFRMEMKHRMRGEGIIDTKIGWDVPLWFWRDFMADDPPYELWANDRAVGVGDRNGEGVIVTLQGLHFHRKGLEMMGVPKAKVDVQPKTTPSGRPPNKYWEPLISAICGQLYRGDLKPKQQADIEKAMHEWLNERQESASEASVRKRSRYLWDEINSEG